MYAARQHVIKEELDKKRGLGQGGVWPRMSLNTGSIVSP
jgi:hypothetical protein